RAAVIAGIADAGKGGAKPRRSAGDAQIAREREAEPGAGDRAVDRGDDHLWHRPQEERQAVRLAQPLGAVLEGLSLAARVHRLDVAAGAPAAPRSGDDD